MITDFYDSFKDNYDADAPVPDAVLKELNKELPNNLSYTWSPENGYKVSFNNKSNNLFTVQIDDESYNKIKDIPKEKWPEYIYRTQTPLKIKAATIGDEKKQISVAQLSENPFSAPEEYIDGILYPPEFPPAKKIIIETDEGDKQELLIRQVAHDNLEEIKISNVDHKELDLSIFMTGNPDTTKITLSIKEKNADTIKNIVIAYKILVGFYKGTVKINGNLAVRKPSINDKDLEEVKNNLEFWTIVYDIEALTKVKFDPSIPLTETDIRTIYELKYNVLEDKKLKWEQPFDRFRIKYFNKDTKELFKMINNGVQSINLLDGPITIELLGAHFQVNCDISLINIIITNIEVVDKKQNLYEFYIKSSDNSSWIFTRKYSLADLE